MNELIPIEKAEREILLILGQKVMLDRNLARLYGIETFNLNKAVKRNLERFPIDFMFQLTKEEYNSVRFQNGILEKGAHSKYLPFVFTEQGVAMLSSVLRSRRAIMVNIQIMRAFVRFKRFLETHKEIKQKLIDLESEFGRHLNKHDAEIAAIFEAIHKMLAIEERPKRKIGFLADRKNK